MWGRPKREIEDMQRASMQEAVEVEEREVASPANSAVIHGEDVGEALRGGKRAHQVNVKLEKTVRRNGNGTWRWGNVCASFG